MDQPGNNMEVDIYADIQERTSLDLTYTAIRAMVDRYLLRDEDGKLLELPEDMFRRVAKAISLPEDKIQPRIHLSVTDDSSNHITDIRSSTYWEEIFYDLMVSKRFMPNSPTLMNAGTGFGVLSACFVLPVGDSMSEIFDTLKHAALIHQSGGGVGFAFSNVRSSRDIVKTTKRFASGPIPFMSVYNEAAGTVRQSGKRHGANMAILKVDHPDIIQFITMKDDTTKYTSFNISVAVTDEFMSAVMTDVDYSLISPSTGREINKLPARKVFELIIRMAHKNGEPGMIFIDTINEANPLPRLGKIEATNPCGEQPLLPYESCNLGSINLAAHVSNGKLNELLLEESVRHATRFLNNVIDSHQYVDQIPQIQEIALQNRKVGLGVMGFTDMLIKMGVSYASEEALELADEIMESITDNAFSESCRLGVERGPFPNIEHSVYPVGNMKPHNSTVTTIAPTGTIAIFAGCSNGIEPLMAISWIHKILDGSKIPTTHPLFIEMMKEYGCKLEDFVDEIVEKVSIRSIDGIPDELKRLFVVSHDIRPEHHIRMQAKFQMHTDNAVSKTVNLREAATPDDIGKIAFMAWHLRCKGFTVYRNNSRPDQVYGNIKATYDDDLENPIVVDMLKGKAKIPILYDEDIENEDLRQQLLYSDEAEVQYISCPMEDCENDRAIKTGDSCVRCDVCGFNGCMSVG